MKVFIVGADYSMEKMFAKRGWGIVKDIEDADLVQFTGGSDVSPRLYSEYKHPRTFNSPKRDAEEEAVFKYCTAGNIPMAGICRGGQFLNVMSGGKMYQDVRGHGLNGTHACLDLTSGRTIMVTSTHHQMMRVGIGGTLLAAIDNIGMNKQYMLDETTVAENNGDHIDVEAVFYRDTKSLCFQPHPEFDRAPTECTDLYFKYINMYLMDDVF